MLAFLPPSSCCLTCSLARWFTVYTALAVVIYGSPAFGHTLQSPDGRIKVRVGLQDDSSPSRLAYSVFYNEEELIRNSQLALVRSDGVTVGAHLERVSIGDVEAHDSTWRPAYGERSIVRDCFNSRPFRYQDTKAKCSFVVDFRCYDSGVAFRITLNASESSQVIEIAKENTQFCFPADHTAWCTSQPQGTYTARKLSTIDKLVERPLTIKVDHDRYLAIAEAGLVDYPALRLDRSKEDSCTLVISLHGGARRAGSLQTPWRVLMIADSAGGLLENNDLLLNLNEPCAISDTSWIRPGKVLREISLTTEGAKACIDFAVANNIQFVEFDAGWYGNEYSDASDATTITVDPKPSAGPLDLTWVIRYAEQRGIGVILYVNRRALERQLDEILPLYQEWGVAGIKFGFVNTGSQKWTTWLHEAVRKAAEHELMVDVHDDYRPTGYSRTYPNLMTQEGVKGDEATPTSRQAITTLFTRNLAGAADHTICYFERRVERNWTHGHQLAKAVCTYSPWQFLYWYDSPLSFEQDGVRSRSRIVETPELELFAKVPTVWDETKVLRGEIGQYAVIARRSGDDWFLGAMNNKQPRELEVPLNFLEKEQQYHARVYRDDSTIDTLTNIRIEGQLVEADESFDIRLESHGGQAVWLTPTSRLAQDVQVQPDSLSSSHSQLQD
ncbi:glycoside hydrolase family 97 protein [Aeoliella sp. ICT_H6.2]|uniref:Glycoside hydrolase family 97 protein n=1 Tax=Aeoliella straminimaris TaxID=2954799 RepID=A0A9X2FGT1_9BACT|nr:glycoside hydrolase family 97 protein [Aeoliella straminimaris]MCO6048168.1 glycoside hydrolase family 97 protein [Aeoliella straminimaris]